MQFQTMQGMPYGQWGGNMQNNPANMFFAQQQTMQTQKQGMVNPAKQASPNTQSPMGAFEVEVEVGNNMPPSGFYSNTSSPATSTSTRDSIDVPANKKITSFDSPRSVSPWTAFRSFISPCSSKQAVMRSLSPELDVAGVGNVLQASPRTLQASPRKHGEMSLQTGASCKPHPNKIKTGGEDAWIVQSCNGIWLTGVLDGVGSWASFGVDSAVYSRTFAQKISDVFVDLCRGGKMSSHKPLQEILETAFAEMELTKIRGSCTLCLSLLFPSGKLHVLNLGDSGIRVVRDQQVVFASTEQQIYFNTPRQLGFPSQDIPANGDYSVVDVKPGDLFLIASDGAWDNLWQEEWLRITNDFAGRSGRVQKLDKLATKLCEEAQKHGADVNYNSPFAVHARQAGLGGFHGGGKLDDTTMVIGQVV